jgi:hypothetical protein
LSSCETHPTKLRKAETLRKAVERFLTSPHLPAFGLSNSFIKHGSLLRRHSVVKGTNHRAVRIFVIVSHS